VTRMICQLCRRRVHKQRNGAWYHDHNASRSCHPGDGSGRKAIPIEAETVTRRYRVTLTSQCQNTAHPEVIVEADSPQSAMGYVTAGMLTPRTAALDATEARP
jgi:hypothetical protein